MSCAPSYIRSATFILAGALTLAPLQAEAQSGLSTALSDGREWDDLGELLSTVEPAFEDSAARSEAVAAVDIEEIREVLRWSGEAGYLLHIRLQTPLSELRRTFPLGLPVHLGVGADPVDALTASAEAPPIQVRAGPGMRASPEHSFYIWTTLGGRRRNRVLFARLTPEESENARALSDEIMADPDRKEGSQSRRRVRIMEGVRAQFARGERDADAVARLDSALTAYKSARRDLGTARSWIREWSEWGRQADQARQRVLRVRGALTLDALKSQVLGMVRPGLRGDVKEVRTVEALVQVLERDRIYVTEMTSRINVPDLISEERRHHRRFVDALSLPDEIRARVVTIIGR